MSGGSWDYAYRRFEEVASRLLRSDKTERVALGKLVDKVAKALHDIEWVDSSDYSEGDEIKAINKALGKNHVALKREVLVERAEKLIEELKGLL